MRYGRGGALGLILLFGVASDAPSQQPAELEPVSIHLKVDAGTPLRLYITQRVPYKVGETVHAKLLEPVWAFDRIVIPAGSALDGQVVGLDPVPKMLRARAILGGDFTPLKRAEVGFANLTLPDGRAVSLKTQEALGLPTIYMPPRPPKKPKPQKASASNPGRVHQFLAQQAQSQLQKQANARSYGFYDLVRGQNKREWIENYLLSKLPYHPQWYRSRTRFDVLVSQPLDFGAAGIASNELTNTSSALLPHSVAQMRLLTTLSSADARVGDPMEGVLSQPLFAQDHKLVLPEGTRFTGKVTLSQHARWFHRGGKLRFAIESVAIPKFDSTLQTAFFAQSPEQQPVQGQLAAVDADPKTVKVDQEGTAAATESKTRLLRPVIAALVAAKSLDNDAGRQTASGGAAAPNTSGRSLAGFSGFGLLGTLAARGPHPIGAALGFYGLGWSVYSNVIARGSEIRFEKNTAMAIQFGQSREK